MVLARDLRDGWARLHEDEVWAAGIEEQAFVLADGRSLGLARPMRYLGALYIYIYIFLNTYVYPFLTHTYFFLHSIACVRVVFVL